MTTAERQKRLDQIYRILFARHGEVACPLTHETPFQLLSAVMLSAQCRDERVNQVTRILFADFGTVETMAVADPDQIAKIIRPCGIFVNKSRNLVAAARMIRDDFGGEVPTAMADLVRLPGIGRKSANVLLGNAFGTPGLPVDTHVGRVTRRLGLTEATDPVKIETEITAAAPPERWCNLSHLLILHGREICRSRNPLCAECPLKKICPSA